MTKRTSVKFVSILLFSLVLLQLSFTIFTKAQANEATTLYYVNAGTPSPDDIHDGEVLGSYTSATDQSFGADPVTGKEWGRVTTTVAPSVASPASKWDSLLYYNGPQTRDKHIEYQFELPAGVYDFTFGFKNPWSGRNVNIIVDDTNLANGELNIGSYNEQVEHSYQAISFDGGLLSVKIQGPSQANLTVYNDPLINFITIKQHEPIPLTRLIDALNQADEIIPSQYTATSIERLLVAIETGEGLVHLIENGDITIEEAQHELHQAIQLILQAINQLVEREQIGIGLSPFIINETAAIVNQVNVTWNPVADTEQYILYHSINEQGPFESVYQGTALTTALYDLDMTTHYFKVQAVDQANRYVESELISFTPFQVPDDVGYFHNNEEGGFIGDLGPWGIYHEGTYYSYRQENDQNGFKAINLYVSDDGINWSFDKAVLDRDTHPDLAAANLESGTVQLNPNTGKIVGWYHYENNVDYSLARLAVASGAPGEAWDYHGSFRPNGNESRDKAYFIDDDGTGYIMSSANMNADFILYRLTPDHIEIEEEVTTLFEGLHREGPGVSKYGDYYYIFTSGAAGWYPTQAMYASAPSIEGPWSELRLIGNKNTFSGQSGHTNLIEGTEQTTHIMNAYRWMHGWAQNPGGARDRWLPISMHKGFAFYDYYEKVFASGSTGYVFGYQDGKLLSTNKPASASSQLDDALASNANDGNYQSSWVASSNSWPAWWMVDLEDVYQINQVQISWFLFNGSEAVHLYHIEASEDGENFDVIFDGTDNKNYGFTSDSVNATARYIRIRLIDANLHNNPNNWYTPQLSEVKVFGDAL
ncbi:Glycosyl hydrolases family 43 [Amphibacillus marinus]|uniref:Glycosyl hydrolases family 43 n=1 Tax=Amphibacillus marinus TaxID=872970 RepID=A0A1H8IQ56_9BACI|nr:discoidin domain-containing protein [Amphibacillus marinus]SEN70542.1 Glycosyl hydrolases family 43 [Amphibacillus marinus]